ncbi:MAG TPA: divalent-cation tolerance protein CutA [Microlunatus sp.]|jgi:periplasmic divalent cation tolerance protein|nr:divalent-cation tolerance protein CutA [Microlunatus sp.]
MTDDVCEVIITADDEGWLIDFTRSLVSDRLAACGHHQPIRSVYRWQSGIQEERELRVALHTRTSLVDNIIERVRSAHPYDVPCLLALPVINGNPAYLEWVLAETEV